MDCFAHPAFNSILRVTLTMFRYFRSPELPTSQSPSFKSCLAIFLERAVLVNVTLTSVHTGVLWTVAPTLVFFLFAYTAVGTWLTTSVFGRWGCCFPVLHAVFTTRVILNRLSRSWLLGMPCVVERIWKRLFLLEPCTFGCSSALMGSLKMLVTLLTVARTGSEIYLLYRSADEDSALTGALCS